MRIRLPDLLMLAPLSGCASGSPPRIEIVEDQIAVVGQELALWVVGSDPDGDSLTYEFEAPAVPMAATTARMGTGSNGQGLFTFRPLAAQIGEQLFDFVVSDGDHEARTSARIDVRSAAGSDSAPIFRAPLASGAVLDLGADTCTSVEVLVEDADSTHIELHMAEPIVEGSQLDVDDDGRAGIWTWCPTPQQRMSHPHHEAVFVADDGDSTAVRKSFLVVLRPADPGECPGEAPTVSHTPQDVATLADVEIEARVTDDGGVSGTPFALYSTTDPGTPPDYGAMSLAAFELQVGDATDGAWLAKIPNPVAGEAAGASRTLYYAISVVDVDGCATDDPIDAVHAIEVTQPGGDGAGLCSDDAFEPNDDIGAALAKPRLTPGTHAGLELCAGNDDWYAIVLGERARVTVQLDAASPPDLDLVLASDGGGVFDTSEGPTSSESLLTGCLDPGDFLLHVYSIFADFDAAADYALTFGLDPC